MYDALLGGQHHFAADRAAAEHVAAINPSAPLVATANRAFLMRAVRALVDLGVQQFLDLGSGLPTVGNVYEIAQRRAPDAGVIYVDIDPVAIAHSRALIQDNDRATVIPGDLRRPAVLLDRLTDPRLRHIVDLDQPTALLMVAVMHFFAPHDDPYQVVVQFRDALAPGSYLALSHLATESFPPDVVHRVQQIYQAMGAPPPQTRTHRQVLRFFDGLDLIEPGLVYAPAWRPEDRDVPWAFTGDLQRSGTHAGVGYKADRAVR